MSNINWDEAPEWADCLMKNSVTGDTEFGARFGNIVYRNSAKSVGFNINSNSPDYWFLSTTRPNTVIKNKDKTELAYQESDTNDAVNAPSHYSLFESVEAIQLLASSMTMVEFRGYCFGNMLKYRARVGGKDDVNQEIGKANKYKELFAQYKNLCRTTSLFGQ